MAGLTGSVVISTDTVFHATFKVNNSPVDEVQIEKWPHQRGLKQNIIYLLH
jgi:hypothetical protein